MTEERFRDIEVRMRKVEDFILSQLNTLLELSQSLKCRVEVLEAHDIEFMAMVHNTCDIKNKEIMKAREESIDISHFENKTAAVQRINKENEMFITLFVIIQNQSRHEHGFPGTGSHVEHKVIRFN
jgi:hypothetical protein